LALLKNGSRWALKEGEVVGHGNVLYISSTEPVAVSLTWILLILTQRLDLQVALRNEIRMVLGVRGVPEPNQLNRLVFMDRIIRECIRLFPPNGFMVRRVLRPVVV